LKTNTLALISLFTITASSITFANTITPKKEIYTEMAPAPIGVYSQALQSGDMVYISGQIPVDPRTGEMIQGDFNVQVKQALQNLSEITKAAGGNLDNIVKLTVYLADLNNFGMVNEIMKESFHKPYPARVAVEIKSLPKHASVEIEAVMQSN
jgi:reactive intermediate/imine deaminase